MRNSLLYLLIPSFIFLFFCSEPKPDIVFKNINVLPMTAEIIYKNQTVIVRNEKIIETGSSEVIEIPENSVIIDGENKYLLPGLSDMHVHAWTENDMVLFIANGVTSVRNMGGAPIHLELRKKIEDGEIPGPNIYTAGPVLDGYPPFWPESVEIEGPIQAQKTVYEQKQTGYDFIKIYNNLSRPAFDAIVENAKKYEMPVAGHIPFDVPLEYALQSGIRSIEHFEGYGIALLAEKSVYKNNWQYSMTFSWLDSDNKKLNDIVSKTGQAKVWNCPTMIAFENMFIDPDSVNRILNRPEMKYMPHKAIENWTNRNYSKEIAKNAQDVFNSRQKLLQKMKKYNCPLLIGTDCGNPFTVPGFSIHDEMACFVRAGFTPFETLKIATVDANEFLQSDNNSGMIKPGHIANLICIDKNPLKDIKNMRQLYGVMVRGKWYSKSQIKKMLNHIAQQFGL